MSKYKPADGCRNVWMMVTLDEYELPLLVADTAEELAVMAGVKVGAIHSAMSKHKHGKTQRCKYKKVRVRL